MALPLGVTLNPRTLKTLGSCMPTHATDGLPNDPHVAAAPSDEDVIADAASIFKSKSGHVDCAWESILACFSIEHLECHVDSVAPEDLEPSEIKPPETERQLRSIQQRHLHQGRKECHKVQDIPDCCQCANLAFCFLHSHLLLSHLNFASYKCG